MESRVKGAVHRCSPLPIVIAWAIVVIAFLLRLIGIDQQELWFDEALSFHLATIDTGLADALRTNNSPPLYYLLLRAWITLAGTGESAIRLLSACLGTLAVASLIVAGKQFFNLRVGLWSGTVAALSPIFVYYSQEARGYTLLVVTLLWSYILLWRALERNSWQTWLQVSLAATFAVYTHYVAAFGLLPALALLFLWPTQAQKSLRIFRFGVAALLCALCVLPWILWSFVIQPYSFSGGDFIGDVWRKTPPPLAIPKSLEVLTLGPHAALYPQLPKVYDVLEVSPRVRLVGLTLLGLLALFVAVPWGDDKVGVPCLGRRKVWLWSLLVVPLAALWIMSLHRPMYLVGRYDMIAFPAIALLAGLAMAKLQSQARFGRLLVACAALILFSLFGLKLLLYYELVFAHPVTSSNRVMAFVLAQQVRTGDAASLTHLRGAPILYYFHKLGIRWHQGECINQRTSVRFTCRLFPPENERWFGIPADPLPESSFIRSLVASFRGSDNVLWVVVEPKYIADAMLLTELSMLDLEATEIAVPGSPALLRLHFRPR